MVPDILQETPCRTIGLAPRSLHCPVHKASWGDEVSLRALHSVRSRTTRRDAVRPPGVADLWTPPEIRASQRLVQEQVEMSAGDCTRKFGRSGPPGTTPVSSSGGASRHGNRPQEGRRPVPQTGVAFDRPERLSHRGISPRNLPPNPRLKNSLLIEGVTGGRSVNRGRRDVSITMPCGRLPNGLRQPAKREMSNRQDGVATGPDRCRWGHDADATKHGDATMDHGRPRRARQVHNSSDFGVPRPLPTSAVRRIRPAQPRRRTIWSGYQRPPARPAPCQHPVPGCRQRNPG